jgi:hypothetical protein
MTVLCKNNKLAECEQNFGKAKGNPVMTFQGSTSKSSLIELTHQP